MLRGNYVATLEWQRMLTGKFVATFCIYIDICMTHVTCVDMYAYMLFNVALILASRGPYEH